jgi:uncharacterized protein (DUF1684 family)
VYVRSSQCTSVSVTGWHGARFPRRARRGMISSDVPDPARPTSQLLIGALVLFATACSPTPVDDEASFAKSLVEFRAAKDQAFREPDSPVPPARRAELLPLAYFPGSVDYQVPAVLRVEANRVTLEMPTSTGERRLMQRVGTLEFALKGQSLTLGAFIEAAAPNMDRLFVPFVDLTSGTETYPAGRYLDLDRTPTGIYVIDFNRAYNPYCYYNPVYDCPFPPRENRLKVPVRAGEKMKESSIPKGTAE